MEICLEIGNRTEKKEIITLPVTEDNFNQEKPITIRFVNKNGKVKIYILRLTNKKGLCLN